MSASTVLTRCLNVFFRVSLAIFGFESPCEWNEIIQNGRWDHDKRRDISSSVPLKIPCNRTDSIFMQTSSIISWGISICMTYSQSRDGSNFLGTTSVDNTAILMLSERIYAYIYMYIGMLVISVTYCATHNLHLTYRKISNIRPTQNQNLNDSRLIMQLPLPNPFKPYVENEDVVGAAPTGDTPTTSEWSTIVLPSKVRIILETWRYIAFIFICGYIVIPSGFNLSLPISFNIASMNYFGEATLRLFGQFSQLLSTTKLARPV